MRRSDTKSLLAGLHLPGIAPRYSILPVFRIQSWPAESQNIHQHFLTKTDTRHESSTTKLFYLPPENLKSWVGICLKIAPPPSAMNQASSREPTQPGHLVRVSSSDIQFQPLDSLIDEHELHVDNRLMSSSFPDIHFQPQHARSEQRQSSMTDIRFQPQASSAEINISGSFDSLATCSDIQVPPRSQGTELQLSLTQTSASTHSRSNISEIRVPPRAQMSAPQPPSMYMSLPVIKEAKEIDLVGIFTDESGTTTSLNNRSSLPPQNFEQEYHHNPSEHSSSEVPSLGMFFALQSNDRNGVSTRSTFSNNRNSNGLPGICGRTLRQSLQTSQRIGLSARSMRSLRSFISQRSSFSGSNSSRGESHGSVSFFFTSSRLDCTAEEEEPTYLAPAPESEPEPDTPSLEEDRFDDQQPEIEVVPGYFLRLRGARETWTAMLQEKCVRALCPYCGVDMLFIFDAEFVLCPVCRDISPSDVGCEGGGVGLGVNLEDLYPPANFSR